MSARDGDPPGHVSGADGAGRRWFVTVAVMLVATMQILDTSVTNVALPHMQGSLSASLDEITWVFTSFLAANAVILPATGWLVARLGRRRFFLLSTATFMVSSLLSGAAPNLASLIAARLLQGVGGGPLIPLAQAILMEIFPPRQRGTAMAIWGLGVMVAPIVGPTLGGYVTENYSWRWIFYLNLPIGAVALALGSAFLVEEPGAAEARRAAAAGRRFDGVGLALLVLGIGALQVALDRGERLDWFDSPAIAALVAVATVALGAFVLWELRVPHPVVDLRVLANRSFALGTLLITVVGFGLYSSFVLLTFYAEHLLRYDALTAGWVLAPGGLGSLISLAVGGRLSNRIDARWLVATGAATIAYSLWAMASLSLGADFWAVLWPRFVQGFGMGLVFVPLTTMTLSAVTPRELATASGLFNVVRNVGGSVGIAVTTTWLSRQTQTHQSTLVGHVTPWSAAAADRLARLHEIYLAGGADADTARQQALRHLYEEVQRHAAMQAFVDDFLRLGALFVAMVPLVWLMRRPAESRPQAVEPA
jgi:MFS transporter, DHA2 family, multidrug resistance protein